MARWVIFSLFFFEALGRGLNPRESPNREAIGLVMFIYFVYLVESKIFLSFGHFFRLLRSEVRPHTKGHCSLALLGELLFAVGVSAGAFFLAWIWACMSGYECVFLDGTMSRCSLWDKI